MNYNYNGLHNIIKQQLNNVNYQDNQHGGYKPKCEASLIITWIIWFYWCSCSNFKRFYYCWIKIFYPNCISYSRFMHWKNRLSSVIKSILDNYILDINYKSHNILIVDSTCIDLNNKTNERKTLSREAQVGYSSTGKFFGFKVHILITKLGQIVKYQFSLGNKSDIKLVKDEDFFNNVDCQYILADSGYVDKNLAKELKKKNIIYIAKPRSNQELELLKFEKHKGLYKTRLIVESFFNNVKTNFNLSSTKFKTYSTIELNWVCSMLAYSIYWDSRQD